MSATSNCSKCGTATCACNAVSTDTVSKAGDGSNAAPFAFSVKIDPNAANLTSVSSNGLLSLFFGANGVGTTFSGNGTMGSPFTVNVDLCAALNLLNVQAGAVGDRLVAVSAGNNCKLIETTDLAIAVATDDTIDGDGLVATPLSVNICESLKTLPQTGTLDADDRLVVYDFVNDECKTVEPCCPALNEITDADLVVAGSPTSADITAFLAANPSFRSRKIFYIGAGTADDPDYTWYVAADGSFVNDESPAGAANLFSDLAGTQYTAVDQTVRRVIDCAGNAYPNNLLGEQIIDVSHSRVEATAATGLWNQNASVVGEFASPASPVAVINNPSTCRAMNGMLFGDCEISMRPLNAGGQIETNWEVDLNGAGFVLLPGGQGPSIGPLPGQTNIAFNHFATGHLAASVPAGGNFTFRCRARLDVIQASAGSFSNQFAVAVYVHQVTV